MGSASNVRTPPGSALAGTLLVFLGLLLLLTTTGTVSFGIWLKLFDFWPAILVLIGVEIIFADAPFSVRAGIISLAILGAATVAFATMPQYESGAPLRVSYVEPADYVETLHLNASFLGGELAINSESSIEDSSAALVIADFSDRPARVIRKQSDNAIAFEVVSSGPYLRRSFDDGRRSGEETVSFPFGLADWTLTMSPDSEVEIDIDSIAAGLDLDLRNVNVRRLSVEGAVVDLKIQLPISAGETQVDVAAGVANVELVVPGGVSANIEIDSPLGSTQVDPNRFVETQEGFRSIRYSETGHRVDIDVEALSANVTVN